MSWKFFTPDNVNAPRTVVPVDLRNPQTASNAGNCYPGVTTLTDWERWAWRFKQDVDGKLFGIAYIPFDATVLAQKVELHMLWGVTSGVARFSVATYAYSSNESDNPGALNSITAQDVTMPGTAGWLKKVEFTQAGETWNAGDVVVVEVYHEGLHANDTVAAETILNGAYLVLS